MLDMLTEAQNLPFSVSLAVVLLLALLQFAGLADTIGADLDVADLDLDADVGVDGGLESHVGLDAGLLSLIGLGRVPFVMWLMILLGLFGLIGLAGQQVLAALTGGPWSAWLAAPASGLVALPATGAIARPLGRILPRDETSAIDLSALVGREAQIVIGTARQGSPARAKATDHFGQVHYVMLEPDNNGQAFVQDERVLLVRREGELFKAIARGDHYLPALD